MSFILDALKKSESERHRNSGPVLMDVRIAPPRRRLPAWAWVIIAVLVANFMVLAWLLWLSPAKPQRQRCSLPPTRAAAAPPRSHHAASRPGPPPALPEPSLPPAAAATGRDQHGSRNRRRAAGRSHARHRYRQPAAIPGSGQLGHQRCP